MGLWVLGLTLVIRSAAAQAGDGVALSVGHAWHSYGTGDRFTYRGIRVGFDAPVYRVFRIALRAYDMQPKHQDVDANIAADVGGVLGGRIGPIELSGLFGLSILGKSADDVADGWAVHVGLQARIWAGPVGLFGEVIRRDFLTGDGISNLALGAVLRP